MNPIPAETTKEKLFQEFNTVVAETEQLIKTAAGAGSDKAGALKASLDQEFSAASERLERRKAPRRRSANGSRPAWAAH